ncbi:MAG: M3 family peptidase [Acidobacteria bacterium]|nr:MAG: M3 family peptidase [Acidobacteriota bacterium]
MTSESKPNPLLQDASTLPPFDVIEPAHVVPGIRALLEEVEAMLAELEAKGTSSWEGIVEPLERMHDRLGFGWGLVEHLLSVKNSDALRDAYKTMEPEVVKLSMKIARSQEIYRRLTGLREKGEAGKLDAAQERILEKLIQAADLAGVGLEGEERERFQALKLELAELSTRFGNHLLDATKAFRLQLLTREEIEGLPESYLKSAAQSARDAGSEDASAESGPWRVSLDAPSFLGFMNHSARRDLRETLYRALVSRASEGELDNRPLIDAILKLRREESKLLGFETYAELSLSRKMAGSVERAEKLLEELRVVSYDAAQNDLDELRDFMREHGADETADNTKPWDIAFWSERLREARFDFSEEELRPYFPLPHVLDGLFALAKKLFDIDVVAADGEAPVWHEDVRFFRVRAQDGEDLAAFYMDPYSRPAEKRGGAWMNEVVGRSRLFPRASGEARLPVAYLVCNGSPPVDDKPSLMTFREIETLFHEFGHTLQHMLTRVDYGLAAGIRNVEWDAVELPSQFMENWCYHRETLIGLSENVETKEKLPDWFFEKILAARTFRSASHMLRQLNFGVLDLELHHRFDPSGPDGDETVFDVQRRVADKTTVLPPIPEDRFLCGFSHIFQGGYSAGYYSYKWAEVLSADAFGAFEEAGLDEPGAIESTGKRFRDTILSLGGSESPMEVFKRFRGREPSTEALLRHSGLVRA